MNEEDMTKNPIKHSGNDKSAAPADETAFCSNHGPASSQNEPSTERVDSGLPPTLQQASETDTTSNSNPQPEQNTERHADVLVINYGDNYAADTYLPPEEGNLANQYTHPVNDATPKKPSGNPDDEEEIEFEKFLRLFKEKTRLAAQKTKVAAHRFRQNSLIRFAHWVSPKLDPYRQMNLPKKNAKTKVTKNTKKINAPEPAPQPKAAEKHTEEPAEPEELTQVQEKSAVNPQSQQTNETKENHQDDFELAEAAPYVPKNIGEFLSLMRRTPKDVISPRERHVIATIMNFSNAKVSEIMQPAENITYVNYEEVLGPLTLDRLYRAGYDHFPVVDNRHKIIGLIHTTALNSLEIKETSRAGDLLDPKVYYVREDYTLNQALAAFLRTNCYFFLVIDRYEKIVGLLTYQMLMSYLLGETPEDDFYRDEDRLAVAKRKLP